MSPSRMPATPCPNARLAALREAVRAIEHEGRAAAGGALPFGLDAVDSRLADGGLAVAALHEAAPASPALGDDAAATLFVAAVAARLAREEGTILWALARRDLFAPGLAQVGLAPERLLYAECHGDDEVLAVMEEGLRHGGLAAMVGEVRNVRLAAARRLQLAAEEKGTTALVLRRWRRAGADPLGLPSPAVTRWRIGCAPSEKLAVPGVGRPRWQIDLVRQRGGEPWNWILEAPDAEARLALSSLSADREDPAGRVERRAA